MTGVEIIRAGGRDYLKLNVQLKKLLAEIPDEQGRLAVATGALSEPLKWFCPNGKQEELINVIADRMSKRRTPVISFTAANGVGKTESAVQVCGNVIYGAQNGWFLKRPFLAWPNPKVCWYITTKTGLTDTVIPAIKRLFPPGSYSFDKMGSALDRAIHFQNGWEWRFFTMDVDPQQMESASVGLIVIDEPAPEAIWKACKSRARGGQLMLLPMTPLDVEPYILDEIERNKDTDLYARVTASVYDACEERGIRGHLEAQIIDEMVAKYPEDEKIARVEGEFMYFREKIWINLDPLRHHVDPDEYPVDVDNDYFMHVVDPHDSRPTASFYMAIQAIKHSDEYLEKIREGKASQQFRRIVFLETPTENDAPYWEMVRTSIKLEDEPEMWAELEDSFGLKVVHDRIVDKQFAFQSRMNKHVAQVYATAGRQLDSVKHGTKRFVYRKSYDARSTDGKNEIAYGHNAVIAALDDLEDGRPGLVIWKTCVHTCAGMTHYVRKRRNRGQDLNVAAGDSKIIEKYKDFNDLLRYGVCAGINNTFAARAANPGAKGTNKTISGMPKTGKSIIGTVMRNLKKAR